jgi:hypothetical protein
LGCGALMIVPPSRATSGTPYWASFPKSLIVVGWSLPKFHAHPCRFDEGA